MRPADMDADLPIAGDMVDDVFQPGFLCYGVPIGSEAWVAHMLPRHVAKCPFDPQ